MLTEEMVVKLVFKCSYKQTWSHGWIAGKAVVLLKYEIGQQKIVAVSKSWKPQGNNQKQGNVCWQICVHTNYRFLDVHTSYVTIQKISFCKYPRHLYPLSYELFIKGRNKEVYTVIHILMAISLSFINLVKITTHTLNFEDLLSLSKLG